jgi:hypothetical protein
MGLLELIYLRFHHATPWKFTSSAGGAGGLSFLAGSGGALDLENTSSGEKETLHYLAGGVGVGSPVSATYSTRSMWSRGIGTIYAASSSLSFKDMKGPMCIIGGSATVSLQIMQGGSVSIFIFGLGGNFGLDGVVGAKAMGMMTGRIKGVDAGLTVLSGWAH